ncbi:MAG: hypothetical protein KatS3mg087_0757 [Patescibacteria group bacterium]|nr:MAG: hypothetical protein KatS3mg087_0757 [Patescibacteria group bacterium]
MSLKSDLETLIRNYRVLLRLQRDLPPPQRQILEVLMYGAYANVAPEKLPIIKRGAIVDKVFGCARYVRVNEST